jgi:hypothetical protein
MLCTDMDLKATAAAQSMEASSAIASLERAKELVERSMGMRLVVEKAL